MIVGSPLSMSATLGALPNLRSLINLKVAAVDAELLSFDTLEEYEQNVRYLICDVLNILESIAPEARASLKQMGFVMCTARSFVPVDLLV